MPANEKRRYVMTSDLRQYIAEYTVANFLRYPIRRRVTYASALEFNYFISKYCYLQPKFWTFGVLHNESRQYLLSQTKERPVFI